MDINILNISLRIVSIPVHGAVLLTVVQAYGDIEGYPANDQWYAVVFSHGVASKICRLLNKDEKAVKNGKQG